MTFFDIIFSFSSCLLNLTFFDLFLTFIVTCFFDFVFDLFFDFFELWSMVDCFTFLKNENVYLFCFYVKS